LLLVIEQRKHEFKREKASCKCVFWQRHVIKNKK
jgi:hypothetical protein